MSLMRALALFLLALFAVPPVSASPPSWVSTGMISEMRAEHFWDIVDKTTRCGDDQLCQIRSLRSELERLTPEELLQFQLAFRARMREAFSPKLYWAGYVIHGGLSDDSFDSFLCWLISKGSRAFRKALTNPDQLAHVISGDAGEALAFDDFGYVAGDVWVEKTASDWDTLGKTLDQFDQPFADIAQFYRLDDAELARRYPALWRRFGQHPLS